eukprot:159400-Hanusia_phi.AAC.1
MIRRSLHLQGDTGVPAATLRVRQGNEDGQAWCPGNDIGLVLFPALSRYIPGTVGCPGCVRVAP